MGRNVLTRALWVVSGAAMLCSIVAWRAAIQRVERRPWGVPALAASPELRDSIARPGAVSTGLRSRDPFRLDRRPSGIRFQPFAAPATIPASQPAPVRPTLVLAGVVGGPPWRALIEGIPGREGGAVLSVGETVNGIQLVQIRGDTARLSGHDMTWVLTPRRAGQP